MASSQSTNAFPPKPPHSNPPAHIVAQYAAQNAAKGKGKKQLPKPLPVGRVMPAVTPPPVIATDTVQQQPATPGRVMPAVTSPPVRATDTVQQQPSTSAATAVPKFKKMPRALAAILAPKPSAVVPAAWRPHITITKSQPVPQCPTAASGSAVDTDRKPFKFAAGVHAMMLACNILSAAAPSTQVADETVVQTSQSSPSTSVAATSSGTQSAVEHDTSGHAGNYVRDYFLRCANSFEAVLEPPHVFEWFAERVRAAKATPIASSTTQHMLETLESVTAPIATVPASVAVAETTDGDDASDDQSSDDPILNTPLLKRMKIACDTVQQASKKRRTLSTTLQ